MTVIRFIFYDSLFSGISLVLTPAYIIGTYNFPIPKGFAGELFCRIVASYFLVFYLGIVSVFTITCLALERYVLTYTTFETPSTYYFVLFLQYPYSLRIVHVIVYIDIWYTVYASI